MQNWKVNNQTGDYIMRGGAPEQTDSLTIPAYFRLKIRRQGWMYAPDKQYGSDFWTIKKRQTTQDTSAIENTAARALQPLVDDGRAAAITVDNDAVARNGVGIKCKIYEASGREDQLNLEGLGV